MYRERQLRKLCAHCDTLFVGPWRKLYCSPKCRREDYYVRVRLDTEEKKQKWIERAPIRERTRR